MNFKFSKSNPERIPHYTELFQRAFPGNKKLTCEYLHWLYRDNPDGALVGFDAFHEQRLVGHYACIPREYVGAEGPKRCLHSVNTATDPEYTRQGLFTRLAEMTYDAASQANFQLVWMRVLRKAVSPNQKGGHSGD
jgi:GNAT superfamily N-acetyltransferase